MIQQATGSTGARSPWESPDVPMMSPIVPSQGTIIHSNVSANARVICGRVVRWNEDRARNAYSQGWWSRKTLADAIREAAAATPERIVLIDAQERLDCRALYSQTSALAQALLQRVPIGSVVSLMLPNWHEAAVIYLAAGLAGMVVHPILPSMRDRELKHMLQDADSRMIFIPGLWRNHDYLEMLQRVTVELPRAPQTVVLRADAGPFTRYTSLLQSQSTQPLPALDPDAVRLVLYTSGTTGKPKGVMHSHNSIHAVIRQIGAHWLVEPDDAFLVASPISHIGGSLYAFECPLMLGTRAILMERWDPDAAVRLALSERCTHIAGATPFLAQLLAAAQRTNTHLPDLKLFVCGGASVSPSLIRQAASYFERAAVTRVYGCTEVPVITIGTPDRADSTHAAQTDGKVGIAEVKLTTPSGDLGEAGEIRVRGPQMLVGYLHPDDEAGAFDEDGYFRTGDLARREEGDYLTISGRSKDIIIRNGENISPKEIEDVLIDHPDIAEIAIVGLPDSRTGERACAIIVPKRVDVPDVQTLHRYLTAKGIATFKFPEQVIAWPSLPKNDAGKILKHQVREQLIAQTREE
jgi:cyclohexanecarboxylate-CoA ligase